MDCTIRQHHKQAYKMDHLARLVWVRRILEVIKKSVTAVNQIAAGATNEHRFGVMGATDLCKSMIVIRRRWRCSTRRAIRALGR
jgi:hypothetical protein